MLHTTHATMKEIEERNADGMSKGCLRIFA